MPIFISHSFENKPEFANVADALERANVPYWSPEDIKPGSSLRDQLRDAVESCSACVFVATHVSLNSSWCGTELGAFWGAGKSIVVYLADSSLKEADLPPIVQPDVWERRLSRVAARAKELEEEHTASDGASSAVGGPQVGGMTTAEFERLIVGAVSLALAREKAAGDEEASPELLGQAARSAAGQVLEGIRTSKRGSTDRKDDWTRNILWVDDRPANNIFERQALEALNLKFTLALTTDDAMRLLSTQRFAAIISDMGRQEGAREGYVLLEKVREADQTTPYFIYAGSNAPKHRREALRKGAQGSTNRPQELFDMIVQALPEQVA